MARAWPTDLDADGGAPTSIAMVGTGDEHLTRQAQYQLQAAMQLEERGYKVDAFQVPLTGKTVRITLPVVAKTPTGTAVIIYTQSEDWTPERISDLEAWIAHLREESDAAVVVASRVAPPDVPTPGVAEFLHLPYDTLNRPGAPAPAPIIADEFTAGAEPAQAEATTHAEDDPAAPHLSVVVLRNDRGTEDVRLMAGGLDGAKLASAIEKAFPELLNEHMARAEFSGHIQIVVLDTTPPSQRAHLPAMLEHLRGICAEASKDKRYRVTLTYQRGDLPKPSAVETTAAALPPRRWWSRPMVWGPALVIVAVGGWFASRAFSTAGFPNTISYSGAPLEQAAKWTHEGTSGVVYVRPGEAMPDASLQLGVIVSSDYKRANQLMAWVREQSGKVGRANQRYHDVGTNTEACVVGISQLPNGWRTYLALQLCRENPFRADCVESDEAMDSSVTDACLNNAACFDDACEAHWRAQRANLDKVAADFLK